MAVPSNYEGFVYLISPLVKWPCKIGVTHNVPKRLATLQAFHWEELKLFHCRLLHHPYNAEAAIHRMLQDKRLRGEWFDVKIEEAIEAIESIPEFIDQQPARARNYEFRRKLAEFHGLLGRR
jgi:hypothetical protein